MRRSFAWRPTGLLRGRSDNSGIARRGNVLQTEFDRIRFDSRSDLVNELLAPEMHLSPADLERIYTQP